ncbi:ATP-binding protein [Glycomyces sp. NPDC046736]|uniref:AAA family ATPase n=1 Tax=Glycomyces sp. NPDC046736 TaxID=3155615 RepID=UPI0033EC98A7
MTHASSPQRPRLVLVCGLPGAGKTTLAKRLAREMPAVRLCPDEALVETGFGLFDEEARARVEEEQWDRAQDLLAGGASVILENGFWGREERDERRLRARELGAAVELRYLEVPLEELRRRMTTRNRAPGATPVDPALLGEWHTQFQAPTQPERDLFDPANL